MGSGCSHRPAQAPPAARRRTPTLLPGHRRAVGHRPTSHHHYPPLEAAAARVRSYRLPLKEHQRAPSQDLKRRQRVTPPRQQAPRHQHRVHPHPRRHHQARHPPLLLAKYRPQDQGRKVWSAILLPEPRSRWFREPLGRRRQAAKAPRCNPGANQLHPAPRPSPRWRRPRTPNLPRPQRYRQPADEARHGEMAVDGTRGVIVEWVDIGRLISSG